MSASGSWGSGTGFIPEVAKRRIAVRPSMLMPTTKCRPSREKRAVVLGPVQEAGLDLLSRGQVADRAVRRLHVEVIDLVAAVIARVEEALVPREVADGRNVVGRRMGERHRLAARDRDGVGVGDARLIAAHEDLRAVGREGGAAEADRAQELLDGVLRHGPRRRYCR